MEENILELISKLSIEKDSDLISALYQKYFELQFGNKKFKDLSYKYSLEKFKDTREMSTLFMGINKTVEYAYENKQYEKAKKIYSRLSDHYCDRCSSLQNIDPSYYGDNFCRTKCIFKNRFDCVEKIINNHETIKKQIVSSIDDEYLLTKLLVNKITVKLNNLKKQKV